MRRQGALLTLLVSLPCLAPARSWEPPIQPHLPHSPTDTLIVFERLASREGLGPGELNYRVFRCLPDGRSEQALTARLDPKYSTANRDSLIKAIAARQGRAMEGIARSTWEMHMDDPARFRVRRHCFNLASERWAGFDVGFGGALAAYELRTGATSVHGGESRQPRLVPDDGPSPLLYSCGSAQGNNGLRVWDGQERTLRHERYYEPASEFFRPQPHQAPVILVYDYYSSDLSVDRDDRGRPLRLLRLDRASASLPIVASLPECRKMLSIAVDAEGGILVSAFYQTGPRLCRIDTLDGFAVRWTDCLPPPPNRYWGWSLSNVSAGRVLASCGLFTDEQGERVLEAKLLDSRTLEPIWSGRIPGRPGWARLAGDRVLIGRAEDRPYNFETHVRVSDVRWDFYTLKPGSDGLRLVPDERPIEFVRSTADPRYEDFADDLDILAAIEGRGFLCWRGDSLTWLH
jgi:hypothetical protein